MDVLDDIFKSELLL